jgi:hypothetical protein
VARWTAWVLGVGLSMLVSIGLALALAHLLLLSLAAVGVRIDGRTEVVYGLFVASMMAPIPVMWVSYALAPAGRWMITAAVCAIGMLVTGLPRSSQLEVKVIVLWILLWTPSWVMLVLLFRKHAGTRSV